MFESLQKCKRGKPLGEEIEKSVYINLCCAPCPRGACKEKQKETLGGTRRSFMVVLYACITAALMHFRSAS